MNVFGSTRSCVRSNHAVIAPDSFVRSALPGWDNTEVVVLISSELGARFTQYLALMASGASAGPPPANNERVIYVLEGGVSLQAGREPERSLAAGGFAFVPPGADVRLRARAASRLNVFEKKYAPIGGVAPPRFLVGREQDIDGAPFLGDSDARLKTLLPAEPAFDLAVNVFTFRPGATLPMVEIHVMEHGLLMLEGQGVYRLGDSW